ncbi:hypothetical protein [Campylobacter helveticus]|uniref:hypothetical protein n=1 Tax=Campylobacter helveticus TaxID=28898 RepID=UPI0022EA35AE|nr:hypothetical protein [Campylobacter helveticus]
MNEFDEILEDENLNENEIEDLNNFNDILGQDMEAPEPMQTQENSTENSKQGTKKDIVEIQPIDPDKPVNFLELTEEQQKILVDLDTKIQKVDIGSLDLESRGIFEDIKNKMYALDKNTTQILNYFSNDLSDKDREIINRTTLVRKNLSELYGLLKFYEGKDYISQTKKFEKAFKNLVKNSGARVDNYENNLKGVLDAKTASYHNILESFIQRQGKFLDDFYEEEVKKAQDYSKSIIEGIQTSQNKLKETTKNFEITTKKVKIFSISLIGVSVVFGVLFGIISAITYLKYEEYHQIEAKMTSLSQRIEGIVVKKDENNHLILSFPKSSSNFTSDKEKFYITIKEQQ